jgi:hypothetical protein
MTMIDRIIAFETGDIDDTEFLNLFSELIRTGLAWSLQGSYGRTAQQLIENQVISTEGVIL